MKTRMMTAFLHRIVEFDHQYNDLIRITNDDGRRYFTPSGVKYPSITTVLSKTSKDHISAWRDRIGHKEADKISKRAADRGTIIHDLMERYVRGESINQNKLMPHHNASFINLSKILDERLSEWYVQEKMMWSDYLKVAGQMDLAGKFDGVRSVIDYKTSTKVKKKEWIDNYFIQEASYSIMFEERTGISLPNLVIIMDVDDSEPIVFKEHRDNWIDSLQDAIKNYYEVEECET